MLRGQARFNLRYELGKFAAHLARFHHTCFFYSDYTISLKTTMKPAKCQNTWVSWWSNILPRPASTGSQYPLWKRGNVQRRSKIQTTDSHPWLMSLLCMYWNANGHSSFEAPESASLKELKKVQLDNGTNILVQSAEGFQFAYEHCGLLLEMHSSFPQDLLSLVLLLSSI